MSDSKPQINQQLIEHIAKLAALELTKEEKVLFLEQFKDILQCVQQIEKASPANAKPSAVLSNHMRPDVLQNRSTHPETFSPYLEDSHFKVPKVIE